MKYAAESSSPNYFVAKLRRTPLSSLSWIVVLGCMLGCGGGGQGSVNPPIPPGPGPTSVTVTFQTPPNAAAVQMGTGSFAAVTPDLNQQVTFNVPAGVSKYAVAYWCHFNQFGIDNVDEFVFEATTQDSTSLKVDCSGHTTLTTAATPNLGTLDGVVDPTFLDGLHYGLVEGKGGFHTGPALGSGSFSGFFPTGANDIAVITLNNGGDQSYLGNVTGLKLFRNQTVPGTLNGGNPVLPEFNSGPGLTLNFPPGFLIESHSTIVEYTTANGTTFPLANSPLFPIGNTITIGFPTVPAAEAQSGDFYVFGSTARPDSGSLLSVGSFQTGSGGGPFTLDLPTPWSSPNLVTTGPPITFHLDYQGFPGTPVIAHAAQLSWSETNSEHQITVIATGKFQNGANTITIPDLSSVGQGFLACCTSGTLVSSRANILAGTVPVTVLSADVPFGATFSSIPLGTSIAFVLTIQSFTAP